VTFIGLQLAAWLLKQVVRAISSPLNVKKLGEWALVTGSTDGIGKAYAKALAKKGLNILLVSRSPSKLQNVAAEIENERKVQVKTVQIDFSGDDKEYVAKLQREIEGLEIGVLVIRCVPLITLTTLQRSITWA